MPRPEEVKTFLVQYLAPRLAAANIKDPPDEMSMIDSGIIDSFGLMEIVQAAEKRFSIELDMGDVDVEVFSTFGGFAKTIAGVQ